MLISTQPPLLILASASPRRQALLQALGLAVVVVRPLAGRDDSGRPQPVDETPLPHEAPSALVQRLSRLKAATVITQLHALIPDIATGKKAELPDQLVIIAADTEVALAGKILGKPGTANTATAMLQQLRAQPHHVYSGLTVARLASAALATPPQQRLDEAVFITRLHCSTVWMRAYTDEEIAAYVASGDPLDKAGAYGIQHPGFAPVARLEGCFASVMGLPLGELAAAWPALGFSPLPVAASCARYTGALCCQQ